MQAIFRAELLKTNLYHNIATNIICSSCEVNEYFEPCYPIVNYIFALSTTIICIDCHHKIYNHSEKYLYVRT